MNRVFKFIPLIFPVVMVACSSDAETTPDEVAPVDLRREFPAPPTLGQQFSGPDLIIPARAEQVWCYFTSYEGDDVGVNSGINYQSDYGHHVVLMSTHADEDDYPNGAVFECEGANALPMTDMEPLFIAVPKEDSEDTAMLLPEGMAVKLKKGTRLVMQSHYVNPLDTPILVNDAVNMGYIPVESVETWAAAFAHTNTSFKLPPSSASSVEIKCNWSQDVYVLYLNGHMHEFGTSFTTSWGTPEGVQTVYSIPEWKVEYRDFPITYEYEAGEFHVRAGDWFMTRCDWFNTTDEELIFPEEMCATAGMVYPSTVPLICDE